MKFARDAAEADDGGGINLTPLIDIVFLLLIFFMVTASFQDEERDLAVRVAPRAEGAAHAAAGVHERGGQLSRCAIARGAGHGEQVEQMLEQVMAWVGGGGWRG